MVKKLLIIIFLLSLTIKASEFDFGYSNSDGSRLLTFKNVIPFLYHDIEITPIQKFKDNNLGYMANFSIEAKRDYHNKWDMFFNIDYLTDQVLNIQDRIDFKIGVGYELFNNYDDRHKLSYAVIFRENQYLHSFRYKYVHIGKIFNSKVIMYYIIPTNEITGELGTDYKIFEAVSFSVNHNYTVSGGNTTYTSTAGFKVYY